MNTTYFLNLIAGNVFHTKESPAIPQKYYIGLSSTEPQINGTGVTEPNASAGYARIELTGLTEPVDGHLQNTATLEFAMSTADWGVMTHYVIFDNPTGGNLLIYGQLSHNRTVESETTMTIKSGSLKLSALNPTE